MNFEIYNVGSGTAMENVCILYRNFTKFQNFNMEIMLFIYVSLKYCHFYFKNYRKKILKKISHKVLQFLL